MNTAHIVSSFDRDLETAQALVMRMGGLVEVALLDAAEALRGSKAARSLPRGCGPGTQLSTRWRTRSTPNARCFWRCAARRRATCGRC